MAKAELLRGFGRIHGYRLHKGFLARSQYWSSEERDAYSWSMLRRTIQHAVTKVPYYRDAFKSVGLQDARDLRGPADLTRLPILTKAAVRANNAALVDQSQKLLSMPSETSGTTGEPLHLWWNEYYFALNTAGIFRQLSWAGYVWRDPIVALRSYVPDRATDPLWRYDRPQNTLYMSAYHLTARNANEYIDRILAFQPKFIRAYPSSVAVLAEYAYGVRDKFRNLRGIHVASETLLPTERETIEATFGRVIFNQYGMTEPVTLITECEAHEGMHVNPEFGWVEMVEGDDLGPNERRMILTGYHNPVMPFIRYDSGDVVRLFDRERPCTCGKTMPLVDTVLGRKDECIVTPDGRRLPSVNFYTVFRKYHDVARFQIVQYGRNEVAVKLAMRGDRPADESLLEPLREEMRVRLGSEIDVFIEQGTRFLTSPDGKTPVILRKAGNRAVEERDAYALSSQLAWDSFRRGETVKKLDWNEAESPPSPAVREALRKLVEDDAYLSWYPDAKAREVTERIGEYVGVPGDNILVASGSDAAIELIATVFVNRGDRVLILAPNYDQFRAAVEQRGAVTDAFWYDGQTLFPVDTIIERIRATSARLVYVGSPNNPVGYAIPRADLIRLAEYCDRSGALLIVDEAYQEFGGESVAPDVLTHASIIVLRTFSKAFGLAGLRIGYLLAAGDVMRALRKAHNPKSVTMFGQVAAATALAAAGDMRAHVEDVREGRERFCRFLAERGIDFYPSEGNFVLFATRDARGLVHFLEARGILVRDRTALMRGVGHVRVTITGRSSAEALARVVDEYIVSQPLPTTGAQVPFGESVGVARTFDTPPDVATVGAEGSVALHLKEVFIAWVGYQRRTSVMEPFFGWKARMLGFRTPSRYLRPFEYLAKLIVSISVMLRERPDVLWVQLAPTPLLHAAHIVRSLFNRRMTIVADCHSGVFRPPWSESPMLARYMRKTDLVLVHHAGDVPSAEKFGVAPDHIAVLEDRPSQLDCSLLTADRLTHKRPWVLIPSSFDPDEPVRELFEAARLAPEITFLISGNTKRAKGRHSLSEAPPNLVLLGYLPTEDYERLLCNADAVIGLTIFEGVQLSVANEAVGAATPMVLSDTQTLRELFSPGAVFVDPRSGKAIADGARTAIANQETLREQVAALRDHRIAKWRSQADEVTRRIEELATRRIGSGRKRLPPN